MLRIAGGGCCRRSNARLSVALIALSTTAIVLALERLKAHSVEGIQLLTVELLAKPGTSVAEPDLHSRFRQFRSVKKRTTASIINKSKRQQRLPLQSGEAT